ncbi:MAG: hypothetical protein Q7T97_03395 [Burkholderiaceae bacterium]|nr:hypothetical protein [Burkholderiaceae bacterium]
MSGTSDVPSDEDTPSLEAKRRFIRSTASQADLTQSVDERETHMSWLFFLGDRVLKLKKPVRFPFLDFTTLSAREFYCREEVRLNSRLAPDVYLGVLALHEDRGRLSLLSKDQLPATGRTVDWLVSMRRLPPDRALPALMDLQSVEPRDIDALVGRLVDFYRRAPSIDIAPAEYLTRLRTQQAENRELLMTPRLRLPDAARLLDRFDAALTRWAPLLHERARQGRIVEGHGDLRPEHVWLTQPPVVIDCLEFNERLRQVDPFDEVAFLAMECALADAHWIGQRLVAGCAARLGMAPPPALMALYTAHRALLRARLAMAHLLDSHPRTPHRWPLQAGRYLGRAREALDRLDDPAEAGELIQEGRPGRP